MKVNSKISEREIKLILVFLLLIIMVSTYLLGFKEYYNKTQKLKAENTSLLIRKNELLLKEGNKERTIAQTKEIDEQTGKLLNEFPPSLTQDRITMMIHDLMKKSDINISTILFHDTSVFYSEEGYKTSEPESSEIISMLELDSGLPGSSSLGITGYKTSLSINYQATYDALKESIRFFNSYMDRMNITDLTAAFDNKTGNLTGMMKLDMYAISGTEREDVEPVIDGMVGTRNIFGTFE